MARLWPALALTDGFEQKNITTVKSDGPEVQNWAIELFSLRVATEAGLDSKSIKVTDKITVVVLGETLMTLSTEIVLRLKPALRPSLCASATETAAKSYPSNTASAVTVTTDFELGVSPPG